MAPAAAGPDPQQQQQQQRERHVTAAHQDYYSEDEGEEAAAAEIKEVNELLPLRLRILKPLRARISELLGHSGHHPVVLTAADDLGGRCLAFIETELSIIAALSTLLSLQQRAALLAVHGLADRVLRQVDPSRHRLLLRRASQCFRRRNSYLLVDYTVWLYYIIEHSSRHRHLLNLGLTPQQLAKPEPEPGAALPLLGIDRLTKKIFRWLALAHQQGKMGMNDDMRVMSIVGPLGIGKTTLAVELRSRVIRHHETSRGSYYFECNVMAQASRGTDRNIRLLQDILSQVSPAARAARSSHDPLLLVHLVSMNLLHKRYFLIIDDLWEASDWEKIKGAFPNNNLGSRILVTTRSTSTARACSSDCYDGLVHEMKPLSEMDSERLLLAKAVGSVDGCLPNNMKVLCDEILRRCDGIPLFIIGMAEWLKEQRLQQQQHKSLKKDRQRFAPERLEQALSSAFNDFRDDDLRLLLFYMSMLPYGYKFEKDRLILKWIHEGLIDRASSLIIVRSKNKFPTPDQAKSELEADRLFYQLVDRHAITCVASNCKHKQDEADEACQWQVNYFIQQFLASKSAEMGFTFTFTTTTLNLNLLARAAASAHRGNQTSSSRMPRRVAFHHPADPLLPTLLETKDFSQTRSLAVSETVFRIPLDKFVNLVVLDLEGCENLKDEDLLQLCRSKMFFLTYLSVRNTRVHKVPHEIKELRTLQTLDISYTQISELPIEMFELLIPLQYLNLRGTRISQLPKQIAGLQDTLEVLLLGSDDGAMNNSVETTTILLPHDVRHLSELQTLATVDLTRHPASFIGALGDLYSLKVLKVIWSFHISTDRDYCEALVSSIEKMKWLQSLTIHCGIGCSMEFLGSLEKSLAPEWLEKFKVTAGRFPSVPRWIV